jgi:hypothetical protein
MINPFLAYAMHMPSHESSAESQIGGGGRVTVPALSVARYIVHDICVASRAIACDVCCQSSSEPAQLNCKARRSIQFLKIKKILGTRSVSKFELEDEFYWLLETSQYLRSRR